MAEQLEFSFSYNQAYVDKLQNELDVAREAATMHLKALHKSERELAHLKGVMYNVRLLAKTLQGIVTSGDQR